MATVNVTNSQVVFSRTIDRPYYNDFNEDKNFVQIVFNPEYAVQARELSQIQSILQNQIERFGQHMFVNGTPILGSGISFQQIVSLNLQSSYANTDIDVNNFENKQIQYSSNNDVMAYVTNVSGATIFDPATVYIRYLTGSEFGASDTIRVSGENFFANVATANIHGKSIIATIQDSVYFVDGYFVKVPKQSVVVTKYTTEVGSVRVGLQKNKTIVTENDDLSLLDPAAESSNFDAPGAHRFKFELELSTRPLNSTDDTSFIELAKFEDGILKSIVDKTAYAEIEEMIARRTYDESGNYTVRPFGINLEDHGTSNVIVGLTPGKAYIRGYEYETMGETNILIDKPRETTNTISQYDINMNYGNYVIVDNVGGVFDVSKQELFDIHCVPAANINQTNANTYAGTKIGTARIRDLNFYGGDVSTAGRKFELYLFDTRFTSLSSNAASTSNSTNEIVLNTNSSAYSNAYQNIPIMLTAGPGSDGILRTITSYNGSTKIAQINPPLSVVATSATSYGLQFDFGAAESFFKNTTYTPGPPTQPGQANIHTLNKSNGQANGFAIITEPSLTKLLFTYPRSFVANNISNISYYYRRKFEPVQFTNGVSAAITASTGEDFEGTTSSSNVASTVMDNFLITVLDKQSSSRANGEQIKVTSTVGGGPEQATFNTSGGVGDTFTAVVLAKMELTGAATTPRIKTLVLANTSNFIGGTANAVFTTETGSNTSIYLNSGQIVIKNPTKTAGRREKLFISDVAAVVKIYDTNGVVLSNDTPFTGYTDVTNRYYFDSGQRDTHYDFASIILKAGVQAPKGPLYVCSRYYNTTSDTGYFSVDSYPNLDQTVIENGVEIGTGYGIIPTYVDSIGGVYPLRDCIDFRPTRQNALQSNLNYPLTGIRVPIPATDFQSDYRYFMGRYDLVILTPNRQIRIIKGTPSISPQLPSKPTNSMVLYKLYYQPYTLTSADVAIEYIDNKRYTMNDIGLLDQRLQTVEYYIALSTLEKNALSISIQDVDGLERTKYGILADNFTSHELGASWQSDYQIAIDMGGVRYNGLATAKSNPIGIALQPETNINTVRVGNKTMLSYSTVAAISQGVATKTTPISEFMFGDFIGQIIASPTADIWSSNTVVQNNNGITPLPRGETIDTGISGLPAIPGDGGVIGSLIGGGRTRQGTTNGGGSLGDWARTR